MVQACLTSKNHGQIAVMWKTVSEACNLACDYCYYSGCGGQPGRIDKIDPVVLEKFIKEYMSLSNGVASFAWQGRSLFLPGWIFFNRCRKYKTTMAEQSSSIRSSEARKERLLPLWQREKV
jgi:uncharacterized protein